MNLSSRSGDSCGAICKVGRQCDGPTRSLRLAVHPPGNQGVPSLIPFPRMALRVHTPRLRAAPAGRRGGRRAASGRRRPSRLGARPSHKGQWRASWRPRGKDEMTAHGVRKKAAAKCHELSLSSKTKPGRKGSIGPSAARLSQTVWERSAALRPRLTACLPFREREL